MKVTMKIHEDQTTIIIGPESQKEEQLLTFVHLKGRVSLTLTSMGQLQIITSELREKTTAFSIPDPKSHAASDKISPPQDLI